MANINSYTKKSTANLINKANKMPVFKSQPSLVKELKEKIIPRFNKATGAELKSQIKLSNQDIRSLKRGIKSIDRNNPLKTGMYKADKKLREDFKKGIERREALKKLINDELTFRKNNRDLYNQSLKQTKRMKARM
jgi:hypothetical protein